MLHIIGAVFWCHISLLYFCAVYRCRPSQECHISVQLSCTPTQQLKSEATVAILQMLAGCFPHVFCDEIVENDSKATFPESIGFVSWPLQSPGMSCTSLSLCYLAADDDQRHPNSNERDHALVVIFCHILEADEATWIWF